MDSKYLILSKILGRRINSISYGYYIFQEISLQSI